ncbi:MAG: hypothetical protein IPJ03_18210 [Ignavibacteriales bacterium]|nr:hypothetical protein [Ignavibacteriales bacterium]
MRTKYLFYFCVGIGSIFDSQVLALLNAISEKKVFKKVYLFLGIRNETQKNEILRKQVSSEIEIIYFKSYPNYPFFNFIQRKSISKAVKSTNINFDEIIFHTRGELIAWHLSKVLNKEFYKNIIPDIRGASVEEVREFFSQNIVLKRLKIFNYKSALKTLYKFSKVSVVSKSLKDYLVSKYKIDPNNIVITPSISDINFNFDKNKRNKIRKELNLKDDDTLLVFSSGGTANWQNNNVLAIIADNEFKVLNLSNKAIHHKNIINKFVSYSEMPSYLNAADAAIIWRDESIVNKVASPVKFSEYICCGLPVISNYSVDMIKEYIIINSCGILINSIDEIDSNTLKQLKQKDKQAISEKGKVIYGIDTIANSYYQTYLSSGN